MRLLCSLALLVPLAVLAPVAAARARSVSYEGVGNRPHFTVSFSRHAHTTDYEVNWHASCDAPNTEEDLAFGTSSTPGERPLRVGRHGRFRMHRHFTNNWGTTFDIHFAGRLRRNIGEGTFSETSVTASDPDSVIHCATGRIHWSARHR